MSAPWLDDGDVRIWHGDVIDCLREMPEGLAQTCVTSPPYWGLRDYGELGQIGLEATPDEYVQRMVDVFREVRRVLRDDGTLWLNLGDSYAGPKGETFSGLGQDVNARVGRASGGVITANSGLSPKNLVGIPWRVAFALQADGWYLRSDIIWSKPNPMPESVTDRPTKAHEYVFLLSKSARYFYDAETIRERPITPIDGRGSTSERKAAGHPSRYGDTKSKASRGDGWAMPSISAPSGGRNARTVWTIATKPYAEAHFAVFPTELPERCIKAGSRQGDTVLDPFMGSGTTAYVARHLGRHAIGCELNEDYLAITKRRLQQLSLLA